MFNHRLLTAEQRDHYRHFCDFVKEHVAPFDLSWDKEQGVPREVMRKCGQVGFVGGIIPKEYGGG
ncbi:MAG TPA: acyl-CoA dehydrogenase family protein, partial [Candidatus Kapabacteria bacterium]|nr:acyl-CoA dehydrogenase family protein [Candidatus Kapabacteria bacterium]